MNFSELTKLDSHLLVTIYDEEGMAGHMWARTAVDIYSVSEDPSKYRFELSPHNGEENEQKYIEHFGSL